MTDANRPEWGELMPDHEIRRAGAEALKLASHLADIVRSSELPANYWEEVALRLVDLLARSSEPQAADQPAQAAAQYAAE